MAVFVVVDRAFDDEVLAIDGEHVTDAQVPYGPLQEVSSTTRRQLLLRATPAAERLPAVRGDAHGGHAGEHGEHDDQNPDHGPTIYAALHQRKVPTILDSSSAPDERTGRPCPS